MSQSEKQTQKVAGNLAQKVTKTKLAKHAVAIALEGELGAGKTTFVKGFARALGIKFHITSPTFVILRNYQLPTANFQLLFHIDAYRLRDHRDLISLGIKELLADPTNIVLIEWSDRVRKILPAKYIRIHIDHMGIKTRKIRMQSVD